MALNTCHADSDPRSSLPGSPSGVGRYSDADLGQLAPTRARLAGEA